MRDVRALNIIFHATDCVSATAGLPITAQWHGYELDELLELGWGS